MSEDVVARLNDIMRQVSEMPEIRRRLLDLGVSAIWETSQAFAQHAQTEFQANSRIFRQTGVKPE